MKTKNPELKLLIWNLINFTGDQNKDGSPERYSSYPKAYFRKYKEMEKVLKDDVIYGVADKKIKKEELTYDNVTWMPSKDFVMPEGCYTALEKFSEEEIYFGDNKKTLKYFYDLRSDIPLTSIEVLDELEALLK